MSARQFWFLFVVVLVLLLLAFAQGTRARAGMMGGIGQLMGPTGGNGAPAPPPGTSIIITESGNLQITTEAGDALRTE